MNATSVGGSRLNQLKNRSYADSSQNILVKIIQSISCVAAKNFVRKCNFRAIHYSGQVAKYCILVHKCISIASMWSFKWDSSWTRLQQATLCYWSAVSNVCLSSGEHINTNRYCTVFLLLDQELRSRTPGGWLLQPAACFVTFPIGYFQSLLLSFLFQPLA
jgi:hypothetical protein